MLTIENTHKLIGRRFGTDMEWMICKTEEESNSYHFIMDRWNLNNKIDYTTKISISRLHGAEMGSNNLLLYRFKFEGHDTECWGSKLDFRDKEFVLESFLFILKRIPK